MTQGLQTAWTDAQLLALRTLAAAAGRSGSSIARELKLSRNAVIGKCDRLGIKLKGDPHFEKRMATRRMKNVGREIPVERAVFGLPSRPRRFSWEETLDTPVEPA